MFGGYRFCRIQEYGRFNVMQLIELLDDLGSDILIPRGYDGHSQKPGVFGLPDGKAVDTVAPLLVQPCDAVQYVLPVCHRHDKADGKLLVHVVSS
ncbi:hypothetical protein SDC9_204288 [bioreactor metagenome]|uniref:Uncharacterized protein n=1 Tax=bioreactor metagenome TaxID=1076179 RepID=A0A645IYV2_9ZZZZ